MKINTKFDIGDKVNITELNRPGRVKSIFIGQCGVEFNVAYIYNGEKKLAYFDEEDLIKTTNEE